MWVLQGAEGYTYLRRQKIKIEDFVVAEINSTQFKFYLIFVLSPEWLLTQG